MLAFVRKGCLFGLLLFDNDKIVEFLINYNLWANYSDEVRKSLKQIVIENFLKSNTFDKANQNGKRILQIVDLSNSEDTLKILQGVFDEQGSNNQIIQAADMDDILCEFFEKTMCFDNLEQDWKKFIEKIEQDYTHVRFPNLKSKFKEVYE